MNLHEIGPYDAGGAMTENAIKAASGDNDEGCGAWQMHRRH